MDKSTSPLVPEQSGKAVRERRIAWMVRCGGVDSVVSAYTREEARHTCAKGMNCHVEWTQVKARRLPECDAWAEVAEWKGPWEPSQILAISRQGVSL